MHILMLLLNNILVYLKLENKNKILVKYDD